jgi:hypothetical protein
LLFFCFRLLYHSLRVCRFVRGILSAFFLSALLPVLECQRGPLLLCHIYSKCIRFNSSAVPQALTTKAARPEADAARTPRTNLVVCVPMLLRCDLLPCFIPPRLARFRNFPSSGSPFPDPFPSLAMHADSLSPASSALLTSSPPRFAPATVDSAATGAAATTPAPFFPAALAGLRADMGREYEECCVASTRRREGGRVWCARWES